MTHEAPPLLILDEPTNHLDIEAREALVQALNDFPGAVVLVSHDWHLVELVADRLWLVADGTAQPFEGDLEDYERRILEGGGRGKRGSFRRAGTQQPPRRAAARRGAAERARTAAAARAQGRGDIARLTKEREALDRALAQPNGAAAMGLRRRTRSSAAPSWFE